MELPLDAMAHMLHFSQCNLALGVVKDNVFSINKAARDKMRNMVFSMDGASYDDASVLLTYKEAHGEMPPGLDSECRAVLRRRVFETLKPALEKNVGIVHIPNGCCSMIDCPKRLYVSAILQTLIK